MSQKTGSAPAKKRDRSKKKATPLAEQFAKAPTVNIQADYFFTDTEKQTLGAKLAVALEKREQLQAHKKELLAQIKAQEEGVNAEISLTGSKVRAGFEVRPLDVFVLFDPKKGLKSFHRKEAPHDFIRSETMLPSDYEQELPMPGLPPGKQPEPAKEKKPAAKKNGAKTDKKPDQSSSPIGETSIGDALNAAAAGKPLKRVPVLIDDQMPAEKMRMVFRKAAKLAGWPVAAIELLDEEALKLDGDTKKTLELFEAHTIRPGASEEPAK